MKEKNKYIVGIKTIILIVMLIAGVILPNLVFQYQRKSYASSFSNTIDTKLGKITIKTNSSKIKKGDIVPIEIYIGGENIRSFVSDLEYDMNLFEEINIPEDIEAINNWNINKDGISEEGYPILYLVTPKLEYACTNSKLATIYLRAIEDIEEDTYFSLGAIYIVNTDFDDNDEGNGEYPDLTLTIEGFSENEENPKVKYAIKYNANTTEEVINLPEAEEKTEGKDYIIYGIEPSRSGYTFKGWNTSSDGSGTTYLPGNIYNIDKELTLYAQWEKVPTLESLYLSSNIYKIGNINITQYEEGDKYISRIIKETTLKEYISNLDTNADIVQVVKQDGQALTENEYVGTGMKLILTKDNETIELKIAVRGDLSGDGKVTTQDLSDINKAVLKTYTLENEFRIAGDMDENGEISVTDLSDINKMLLKIL